MSGSTVATTGCGALIQDHHYSTVGSRPGLKREERLDKEAETPVRIYTRVLFIFGVDIVYASAKIIAQKHTFQGSINKIITDTFC